MCRDEKRYTNVGQLLPSQENKELEREKFEHSLIFKRIEKKKFKAKNIVVNAWKEDQFTFIEKNCFFYWSEF